MAIPAEQELVKHYAVNFADGETAGTEKTVFYTIDGTDTATDLSSQMQGQGAAVFVQNPSNAGMTVAVEAKVKLYGETFDVFLGSFEVEAGEDRGYSIGYGLIAQGLKITVTNDDAISGAADVVVAVVPSNG